MSPLEYADEELKIWSSERKGETYVPRNYTNSENSPSHSTPSCKPSNGVNVCDRCWKIKNGCLASRNIMEKKKNRREKLKGDLAQIEKIVERRGPKKTLQFQKS